MFPGWIFLDVNSQLFSLQVQSWQEKLRETEKAHSALREQSVFPSVKTRFLSYGKLVYLWASTKSPQTRSFSMATSMCCKWVCSYVQPDKMINSQLHSKQPDNKMLRQKLLDLCSRCVWERSFIKAAPTHGSKRKRKKWLQIPIQFASPSPAACLQQADRNHMQLLLLSGVSSPPVHTWAVFFVCLLLFLHKNRTEIVRKAAIHW